ncbi:ClC family H(+)/Cl(-) exchange transporter [Gordonia insulae]|nr:ClC family H(+)/Cl(-) exchange transporter [Gordonia insulae]
MVLLCVLAVAAGIAIGFVGGVFRWCLRHLDQWRVDVLQWSADLPGPGWLIPIAVTAVGATIGAIVVRVVPLAAGSGIQHVEAVDRGEADPPPLRVVLAKFIGGLIAIGSGLILGREGPTVHMGAAIGAEAGRRARLGVNDIRLMQTSLSGAGLGVAFNAPIGGALFAFEEVAKSFRLRLVIPTLLAVSVAVACSRLVLGDRSDFMVAEVETPSIVVLPVFVVFGLVTGVLGVAYNRVILGAIALVRHFGHVPPIAKATVIGGIIGALLAIDPLTAGGGDTLSQQIFDGGSMVLPVVAGLLVVRFLAGPLSYAAGTPGGLFAPMLAVGALWGVLFAALADLLLPDDQPSLRIAMVIVGMSALFGASVRAPITGVVLVVEMVATTSVTIPMAVATACAVLVAHLAGSPPIYDSLREQMLVDMPPGPGNPEGTARA